MRVLVYSLQELKRSEGVGNVALNIGENLPFEQVFLTLGKHRKVLFYSFFSPIYFAFKVFSIKPDLVLVHTTEASFDPVVARLLFGQKYKIVCVAHGLYSSLLKEYNKEIALGYAKPVFAFKLNLFISNIRSHAVKFCDSVIAVSSFVTEDLNKTYGLKAVTINNGVEESFIKKKRLVNSRLSERIIFVGNQYWLKGLHYLILANNLLSHPKKIIAVGINPLQQKELCSLIDCSNVEFKLFSTRKEILREYSRGGIFAMPSVYESFGITYLEALCSGLPVIGSIGTGAEDIIVNGKNGFLVEKRNPSKLAGAIVSAGKILRVPPIDKKFLWRNIALEYKKVIDNTLMN